MPSKRGLCWVCLEQMQEAPETLARDVATFVGLLPDGGPLPRLPHRKPGLAMINETMQQAKQEEKINICHADYRPVRAELLRIGSLGARWIAQEFLPASSTIQVSNPARFRELLHAWSVDPCDAADAAALAAAVRPQRRPTKDDPIIRGGALPFRVSVGK